MDELTILFGYIKALVKQWYFTVALLLEIMGIIILFLTKIDISPWVYLLLFGVVFLIANFNLYRQGQIEIQKVRDNLHEKMGKLQIKINELEIRVPRLDLHFRNQKGDSKLHLIIVSKIPTTPKYDELQREEAIELKAAYSGTKGAKDTTPKSISSIFADAARIQALYRGKRKGQEEYDKDCEKYLRRFRNYLEKA